MGRARRIWTLALAAAALSAVGPAVVADPEPAATAFVIIVHPSNSARSLDRDFVRDAFLKKVATWPDNDDPAGRSCTGGCRSARASRATSSRRRPPS